MRIFFASEPVMMKPAISALSPVRTRMRVDRLPRLDPLEATVACSPSIATPSSPSPAMRVIVLTRVLNE